MMDKKMRFLNKGLLVVMGAITPIATSAQGEVYIQNGDVVVCDGIFYDDGDQSGGDGGPYTNNDYTITLCPGTPGDAVSVEFLGFDLQTNANPNNNDQLVVYDGDDTSGPLVGVGTGNSFVGVSITASINNPTGCLTFAFFCNNGASGGDIGWAGEISCVTPCTYPESGYELTNPEPFNENDLSVGLCPGQEISFDGSLSSGDGVPLSTWNWNWGDGEVEETTGPLASHNYDEPGEYLVTLVVNDENNCNSVNLDVYQVLVSTIPIFNAEFTSPLCTGSPGYLDGNPVQSVTWTALPPLAVSESESLPDATGIPFVSELEIDFFDNGQVLEDCDDLIDFSAIIEHSFIGDLTFWIACPDGTEVLIMDNGASGGVDPSGCNNPDLGGTDLGEPVLGDGGGTPTPGVGYEYTWSVDGEFVLDDADNPNIENNTVMPGLYATCDDICDLVGCPLNGIWTFNILDQWAADNGFLFEWSINFNPEIVPGVTTFTPTIGLDLDSSYWQVSTGDLGIVDIDAEADYVDLMFEDEGSYDFTYTVVNSFACQWDTVVTVEVIPGLENSVSAGPDLIFCQEEVQFQSTLNIENTSPCSSDQGTYEHCYGNNANDVFTYCPDNPGDGTMMTISFSQGIVQDWWDELIIYDGDNTGAPLLASVTGDLEGLAYEATNSDGCLTIQFISDDWTSCVDGWGFVSSIWCVTCTGGACGYSYAWTPTENLDDPTIANPTVLTFDGEPLEYTVLVEPIGMANCGAADQVMVMPGFEYMVEPEDPSCLQTDGEVVVSVTDISGSGPFTIMLTEGASMVETIVSGGGIEVFSNLTMGDYGIEFSDAGGCLYTEDITLSAPVPMEFELTPDPTICIDGGAVLQAWSDMDPDGEWTYMWDNLLGTGEEQTVSPTLTTTYEVFAEDENGCLSSEETVTVMVLDSLEVGLDGDLLICGGSFATLTAENMDGGSGAGYTYNWTWENIPLDADEDAVVDYPNAGGTYCVTFSDDCETPDVTACHFVDIEVPIPADFVVDTTKACVPGVVQFTSTVNPAAIMDEVWFFGDGELSYDNAPAHIYPNPGVYDVTYGITSLIGCEYAHVENGFIQVFPVPSAGFTASPQPTQAPDTEIDFESVSSQNVVDWYWVFDSIANLGYSLEQDPRFTFPIDHGGLYPVTLVVTDENGCSSQVTRHIEIYDLFNLFIPTSFTPNNDGVNDAFFVQGTDIDPTRFEMQIFNRWGEKIFETTDLNEVWYGPAGSESEHYVPDGMYFWRVVVYNLSMSAERHELSGTVSVIR